MRQEYTLGSSPVNHRTHTPFSHLRVFGLWEEAEGFGEKATQARAGRKANSAQRPKLGLKTPSVRRPGQPVNGIQRESPKRSLVDICGRESGQKSPLKTWKSVVRSESQRRASGRLVDLTPVTDQRGGGEEVLRKRACPGMCWEGRLESSASLCLSRAGRV